MDAVTRVQHAMKKLPVDRVPVGFLKHFDYETDNAVAGQTTWALENRIDFLTIEMDGFMEFASDTPLVTAQDWGKIRPHKKTDPYIAGQYDRACRAVERVAGNCATFYSFFAPYSTIKHTTGNETRVNLLYREDPEAITHAMEVIEEDNRLLMDMLQGIGLTGVAVAFQNAEEWRFTYDEYRELLTPWDKRLLGELRSSYEYVLTHLCSWGNEPNNFEVWKDYDMMCCNWGVHIERDMPLAKGLTWFDSKPSVYGGFDVRPNKLIITGTEKEIKDYTKQIIRETGRTGVMISSDCSLLDNTPDEHIRFVVEATEEYETESA